MKRILSILISLLAINIGYTYKELIIKNIDGKPVRIIKVILDGQHYIVSSLATTGGDTLVNLTKKVGGNTSINGSFFCPEDYDACDVTYSTSDRIFKGNGKDYSMFRGDTGIRGIFGFTKDGTPLFVQKNLGYMSGLNINTNSGRLNDIYFGISNFPVLLIKGQNVLRGSEHLIDKKMKTRANKHFICSSSDNHTIYMGVIGAITIYEMPKYLKENFDCYFAIYLDAGGSSAMIYDGNILEKGTRTHIMDAFVVLDRYQYQKLSDYITPQSTPYIPTNDYQLTTKDKLKIQYVLSFTKKIVKKYGDEVRRKVISAIRNAISNPNISKQKEKIYHEILIKLFTIGHI